MMRGLRPIPLRLLAEDAVVRVPDGDGGYGEGVAVSRVRFARTQSVVQDGHRSADAGSCRIVGIDTSAPAFKERDSSGRYVWAFDVTCTVVRSL